MSQTINPSIGTGGGPTSDTSFRTYMASQNQILAQVLVALQKIDTELATVAIIPAPTAGALGTYVLAKSTAVVAFGGTVPATDLTPSNAAGTSTGGTLTGTWTCLGDIGTAGDVSLFVRSA
jgi:hypothetical protein